MQSDLGKLTDDWNSIESIVLYGAGTVSKICDKLFDIVKIKVEYVIDSDKKKQGTLWNGISIVSYEQVKNKIGKKKIVVMAAHTAYNEISNFLDMQGKKEFEDYCRLGQFICEWFWNSKKMNCIYHVDMTMTTICTLKCANCNMFIPYYKERRNFSFGELKRNIDLFFERIDYVGYFGLIGGEPTLNNELPKIIEYLYINYSEKIGKVTFTSNGSVIPSIELIQALKKFNVLMEISDYSENVGYREQLGKVLDKLDEANIDYSIRPTLIWCDFGFPNRVIKRTDVEQEYHLKCCRPEWNGLNDGKFYYCNVSWSAEKSGKFKLKSDDFIELEKVNPNDKEACHQISELSRGTCSFCRICGGCGKDNQNFVPPGIQI